MNARGQANHSPASGVYTCVKRWFKTGQIRRVAAIALLVLATLGVMGAAGLGAPTSRFIEYYRQSAEADLSPWQRVVYSLIASADR